MAESAVAEWTLEGVLEEMKHIHGTMKDRQFAFILGAGASFTSGIPTGQDLARKWLADLHLRECADAISLHQWIADCGIGDGELSWHTAAQHYPQIFERRFEGDREAGYAELEAAMEGKSPSLGYSLLAEIIQHTRHKVVVTTNFDNLVADALAMHAHQSPLVVAHESLAGFVRPQMRRPLVAKIHRDLYLHPINDPVGVATMEQGWKIALKKLFQYFTPVVVGYGGNDGSLMDMLMGLEAGDIAGRMIWCFREGSPPPEKAMSVLNKHRGILVKIPGFDQFMLQLAAKLVTNFDVAEIAVRTAQLGQERADRYRDQANKLTEDSVHGSPAEQRAGEVLTKSVRLSRSWWAWDLRAKAEQDIGERGRIYLEGTKRFPTSAELAENYALFLKNYTNDYDAAEAMFLKAIELEPSDPTYNGNYASFLEHQRNNYDAAESHYKKSIELDPDNTTNLGNYATFLFNIQKDLNTAFVTYNKAMELNENDATNTGNYAMFLERHTQEYEAAGAMYKRALQLDPTNAAFTYSYANFLSRQCGDHDAAEVMYKKAIELAPSHADYTAQYAKFLADQHKNHDAAEELYKKALELDPKNANNIGNYAKFLEHQREKYDAAEEMYKKAFELDPDDADVRGNYSSFLETHRKIPMKI
ncbi:tetratricopeptide repeat protein [Pseudomonas sp. PGPR40]|uniref:tetratricopeptide repeat protein n=1 Tax=Pseudomonas sp. PGPR40 TaxID=2913476 RepID=UPI001EDBE07C|nr:tetratricopeptide repeat protein [Pseudomonas sp. PGPR40]